MRVDWAAYVLVFISLTLFCAGFACGPAPLNEGTDKEGARQEILRESFKPDASPSESKEPETESINKDGTARETSGDSVSGDSSPQEDIFKPAIITPKSFAVIKLGTEQWTLPGAMATETGLHFAIHANSTPVFGGKTGLYVIDKTRILRMDKSPVLGLANWKINEVVVAQAKQLFLWDGTLLSPTTFAKNLDGSNITALVERTTNSFWLGTQKGLWLYNVDKLIPFKDIKSVSALTYAPEAKVLIIRDEQGKFSALQEESAGKWSLRSFDGEGVILRDFLPHEKSKPHFWGVDPKNELLLRKVDGTDAAWWLYRLKPDKDDAETLKISHLLFQHKAEQTWAITATDFYTLTEGQSRILKRPDKLESIKTANSTSDGSLWLSDGKILLKIGQTVLPTSYATDVAPLLKANCHRCHSSTSLKQSPLFDTYAQVKAKVNRMIVRMGLPTGYMPPDGRVGTDKISVLQSWVAGGHKP